MQRNSDMPPDNAMDGSVEPAWDDLDLAPELRAEIERSATASGLAVEAWLERTILQAAEATLAAPAVETKPPPDISRSFSALAAAAQLTSPKAAPPPTDSTSPDPTPPAPPRPDPAPPRLPMRNMRLPVLYRPPPRPKRAMPYLLLAAVILAGASGAAAFYLSHKDISAPAVSVTMPLPPAQPAPTQLAAAAAPPPAPPVEASAPPPPPQPASDMQAASAPPAPALPENPPPSAPKPPTPPTHAKAPVAASDASAPAAAAALPPSDAIPPDSAASDAAAAAPTGTEENPLAELKLGIKYVYGNGVPQDAEKAGELFQKAAQQGLPEAKYNLGVLYDKGEGVPKDQAQAAYWYKSAAEQDFAPAQLSLGLAYVYGHGVPQSDIDAAGWFFKAARLGLVNAQFNIASMYARGQGVKQSFVNAYAWFNLAAAAGDAEAKQQMDRMATEMSAQELVDGKVLAAKTARELQQQALIAGNAKDAAAASGPDASPEDKVLLTEIQKLLIQLHFDPGPADGVMSDRSAKAIRRYQRSRHETPDGIPTPALLKDLQANVQQGG